MSLKSVTDKSQFVVDFERDGVLYTATWSRRLLSNGAWKPQYKWDMTRVASSIDCFDSMMNADNSLFNSFRRNFGVDYGKGSIMTSTRNIRNASGAWDVVHNWNTPWAVRLENAIEEGPTNCVLSKLKDAERITQAYARTKDVDAVMRTIERASDQQEVYFFRPTEEGPAIMGRYLYCGFFFNSSIPYGKEDDGRARGFSVREARR